MPLVSSTSRQRLRDDSLAMRLCGHARSTRFAGSCRSGCCIGPVRDPTLSTSCRLWGQTWFSACYGYVHPLTARMFTKSTVGVMVLVLRVSTLGPWTCVTEVLVRSMSPHKLEVVQSVLQVTLTTFIRSRRFAHRAPPPRAPSEGGWLHHMATWAARMGVGLSTRSGTVS